MNFPVKKLFILGLVLTLLLITAAPVMGASNQLRVFVQFSPGGKSATQSAISQSGGTFHYTFDDLSAFVVSIPAHAVRGLYRNPNVVRIVEDAPRYPILAAPSTETLTELADTIDPNGQDIPYGIDAVQARDVWDADRDGNFDPGAPNGSGVTICIIDTGFYSAHEDLSGIPLVGGTAQVDPPYTNDGFGHGSHVAGTIAAQNNGIGVVGVSPGVSFYIVKYFGDDGAAQLFASDLISGTNDCANNGAKIISMSLGGPTNNFFENYQFNNLYNTGILSIAAAGNAGDTSSAYPASYGSVVSVGAVDDSNVVASFSQQNSQVELAAPGVSVLSTLPFIDETLITVDGVNYQANMIANTPRTNASGTLVDGGICDTTGSWAGMVVLCERGAIGFYDKVMNVQNSGGVAAVIYNNVTGNFLGTLGDGNTSSIIAISLSQADGQYLASNKLGATGYVSSEFTKPASGYAAWSGTSMATPHVSAVAALLWSANPSATNAEIRNAMTATALDLGPAGRDIAYGFGLVQAKTALDYLGGGTPPPPDNFPMVEITAPLDGSTFETGVLINFTGTASDVEDGDKTASLSWESDLQGLIGSGGNFSTTLGAGTHTITASVVDTDGHEGTDSITVTVTDPGQSNTPPTVSITAPEDGSMLVFFETNTFTGTASDAEEVGISGGDIIWTSNLNGTLGTGASISTATLNPGNHIITASVTDSGGLEGSDSISIYVNTRPAVTISSPTTDPYSVNYGTPVLFDGWALDAEDWYIDERINWVSDLDGLLGIGASVTASLSAGTHLITASVTDNDGLTGTNTVTVIVNAPPSVSITAPQDGATFTINDQVSFTGTASDAEDGDKSAAISWTSDLQGNLGSGASFSTTLNKGTHIITASVTDSGGLTRSDSITVTVTDIILQVSVTTDKTAYTRRDKVMITVHVTDGNTALANANVSVMITTASQDQKTFIGTTDANGDVLINYKFNTRKDGYGDYSVFASATLSGYLDGNGATTFKVE